MLAQYIIMFSLLISLFAFCVSLSHGIISTSPSGSLFVSTFETIYYMDLDNNQTNQIFAIDPKRSSYQINKIAVDSTYVYFGLYWSISRMLHNGSDVEYDWVNTNQTEFGNGLLTALFLDQTEGLLYYQTQQDLSLYILNVQTKEVTRYGTFGQFSGQLVLYNGGKNNKVLIWGEDKSATNNCDGLVSLNISSNTQTVDNFYCTPSFSPATAIYDNTILTSSSTLYAILQIDFFTTKLQNVIQSPIIPCNIDVDVLNNWIFVTSSNGSEGEVIAINIESGDYFLLTSIFGKQGYTICSVAFVK